MDRMFRRLFVPVEEGQLTLPEPVTAARATLARVNEAMSSVTEPPSRDDVYLGLVEATVAAKDPAVVDMAALLDHDALLQEYRARVEVLRAALQVSENRLRDAVIANARTIVTDHIAVAGEELWARIVKAAKAIPAGLVDPTPSNMVGASDKERSAFLALQTELSPAYFNLREALRTISQNAGQLEHDTDGDHAEFKVGLCQIRPNSIATALNRWPWPESPVGKLIWLVQNQMTPWWPTPAQRDAAWMTQHHAHYEQMRRRAQAARMAAVNF
jgi:predicted NBD/HSP70 family sugar kinase